MTPDQTPPDLTPHHLKEEVLERSKTIPSSWYVHPAYHKLDQDRIYARTWQYVGSAARLAAHGDYMTDTVAGNPVVIIRDKAGDLKGYFNVCKHRGGPLAMDDCGHSKVLQCKYHGWTYLLDGSLRGVPRFDRTELFDKKDFGLDPVCLREWQGLIFACLEPNHAPPFDEVMEGISERIAPMDLSKLQFHVRDSYDVKSNWKVYVDNYLEGYHIPLVHPDLMTVLDFRSYQTEMLKHYSLQFSPLAGDTMYGSKDDQAFYYFIYPNIMLNILPGRLQVNRVDALKSDSCRTIFDYYYDSITPEDVRGRIKEDLAFSDQVQAEDIEICEYVFNGLASRAYDQGRFSYDLEGGVHHFQQCLKRSYRAVLDEMGAS
ncbi:MAG: aromatic ring-hydroxylating dioxygenase subunit alpha [Bacteroidetes Order II. Incertae sedis bacterium]|nr:aromatic ring-hydroxylating dioxygenase subunit alpha [Bacteroidetes Order II. bacterium]MBT4051744.1 aromatic ring-hydroxylating dioxygenase subunit alpha [Bacteroidetes Order II. bacterium]MBT4603480.1 aromatic ring-hydroxylating dioxygenase subunit alpha [Bacteroidetes Order II. bacterium]MBT5249204.1 aromatic ring-hydroxylating dioxygenase subunit alpha [Bacteroidetes Order II. bacterium]MBT6199566.1 aromatic ring-hydroxylating dioxygenase subunit alpha [Bacteroidetes Order II. bacterium